jgi:beta-galactosidase
MTQPRTSARAQASSPASAQVRVDGRALLIGSERVPMLSGAMHYFRLDPSTWRPALEALKRMGLTMVETYVPWGMHEEHDGSFDFGERDPRKDLGAFLDLAHEVGLYAFIRPGPHINAELTYFGLPARIVFDEACQARSPRGNPLPFIAPPKMFPVPSYGSERFLSETSRWFGEVAKVIAPRCFPNGPVVLLQVDNEAAFYFRDGPYDQDYHPDCITKYRDFVRRRYATLDGLNEAYATTFTGWQAVEPPAEFDGRSPATVRRRVDFMEWQERLICDALDRMRVALRSHGLGALPTVHNLPMGDAGLPAMLARVDQSVDITGLDYYHRRHELRAVRERTLRMAGSVRFPCSPEMGAGAPPWFAPRNDRDSLETTLAALAYGVRGLNLYMAVDRDRWYGAPIDEQGAERPAASLYGKLISALRESGFHDLSRRTEVGILLPKEYVRLSRATHTLGALSPTLLDLAGVGATAACLQDTLGFASPIQVEWARFVDHFARALSEASIPYVYIESDAEDARLSGLRMVITPSFEVTDAVRWQRVCAFAANGGHVVYGPRLPSLDGAIRARAFAEPLHATFAPSYEPADAARLVADLAQRLDLQRNLAATPSSVEVVTHESSQGVRALFVVCDRAGSVHTEVTLPEPMTLVDVLDGTRLESVDRLELTLHGPTCRMYLCETAPRTGSRSRPPSARRSAPPC